MNLPHLVRLLRIPQLSLGSALGVTGAAFFMSRLIQLGSAVFLSRLLTPSDFGLLAIVTAIQTFSTQLTAVNLGSELVRCAKLESHDVDVAWTYEFLRNLILFVVIFVLADFLASLLKQPDAALALRVSSLSFIIASLRNPYLVQIRRDKLFVLLGVMDIIPAFILAITSVFLVVFLDSYMGVIYAMLASTLSLTCLSYFAFPAHPRFRFSLRRLRPMLQFGGKLFIATVIAGLESNFPVFLVSALSQPEEVGLLNRSYAFSLAIALSFSAMIWRVCYPHYAQLAISGPPPLAHALRGSFIIIGAGLIGVVPALVFASDIIVAVLGPQWSAMSDLWSLLLLASLCSIAASPLTSVLHATKNENAQIAVFCSGAALAIALTWLLYLALGLIGIGVAVLTSNALVLFGYHWIIIALLRRKCYRWRP